MAAAAVSKGPQRTILVVEEEPDVSRLMRRIASGSRAPGLRARILAASSGARALQIAARTRVDLVILDVKLPDVSGTEVLRRLRSVATGVPVIIVTSHGSAGTVRTAMELGAFDYLTKPFANDEMKHIVRAALASRAAVPIRLGA